MTQNGAPIILGINTCPICQQPVEVAASLPVAQPGQDGLAFWGIAPRRAICHDGAWLHFSFVECGETVHRVVYMQHAAVPTEREARDLASWKDGERNDIRKPQGQRLLDWSEPSKYQRMIADM